MNSRVKQAQKEGATVGDIAAGLAISVIKNALFKVIKIRDPHEVGEKVIVQGGTFLNDAVLRAFEQLSGVNAVRPDIAGNMGAYGAALLARDRYRDARGGPREQERAARLRLLSLEQIEALAPTHRTVRCKACSNHCLLTVNDFGVDEKTGKHRRFITGNRCEKGAGGWANRSSVPNLFEYKSHRLFDYEPLSAEDAPRGTVGIPRALNMYENYPFWFTFFTKLGYRVVLSDPSSKKTYEAGIESMPSESVCYPAKLSHGHVMNLLDKRRLHLDAVQPNGSVRKTPARATTSTARSWPAIRRRCVSNIDELRTSDAAFLNPWLPYDQKDKLKERLFVGAVRELRRRDVPSMRAAPTRAEVADAVDAAWAEDEAFKDDIRAQGRGDAALDGGDRHARHRAGGPSVPSTTPKSTTPSPSF